MLGRAGAGFRWTSTGGRRTGEARLRRPRVAAAEAAATLGALSALLALSGLTGCQTLPASDPAAERVVRENLDAGLDMYAAGDFVLAARRFHDGAEGARRCGDPGLERRATTAECTAWLRARRLADLGACTLRLEALHRKGRRSDPGLNTLLAMGAVAGHRPLPPFRVPSAVHPMLRAAAKE